MQALAQTIRRELPFLRRYARALCGEQATGDLAVRGCLERLLAEQGLTETSDVRVALFRMLHEVWKAESPAKPNEDLEQRVVAAGVARLPPLKRQALLLTVLEGFAAADVARILDAGGESAVRDLVQEAKADLRRQEATRILIIEDEPVIALDLASTVEQSGHKVVGIASTHREAVALAAAQSPGLVLADIQLADDSSGIDAAAEILAAHPIPVIFITAFPERLLTGEKPEPAFLVTKPFRPETVKATISQALFFDRRAGRKS
jgi:CheY-like chemotaxis protein